MFDSQTILTATGIAPVQAGAYIPHTGWSSTAGPNFDAVCPADGKLNARIAGATAADFDAIIQAAVAAQSA